MGKTILISSHILAELADCGNWIGSVERGILLAAGNFLTKIGIDKVVFFIP